MRGHEKPRQKDEHRAAIKGRQQDEYRAEKHKIKSDLTNQRSKG